MASTESIVEALGAASVTFGQASSELKSLFHQAKEFPPVELRYREWRSFLSTAVRFQAGDEALFVRHTYLAILARLIARAFLEPDRTLDNPPDLHKTITGEYFLQRGISNFIEDDFFTWILSPSIARAGLELVAELANTVSGYDFGRGQPDHLASLYQELVDPPGRERPVQHRTPTWLAEYILDQELDLSNSPDQSVFDPCCGPGTFLCTAIRLIASASSRGGTDQFDTLFHILNHVAGMDGNPLAVSVARTNYLLALGDLVKDAHPPFLLPVYLSDPVKPPDIVTRSEEGGGPTEEVYTFRTSEPAANFQLPESVAANAVMLDWLFDRIPNYLKGAELRRRSQNEEEAVQEVLNAFHNYLVAPKPRSPIPEPLSAFAAEVMGRTMRLLLQLYLEGKDHLWLFMLKNLPASIHMARRKFDLVVGNLPPDFRIEPGQPGDAQDFQQSEDPGSAAFFFTQCSRRYLKDTGRIAMVIPRAVLSSGDATGLIPSPTPAGSQPLELERVVDLEQMTLPFNHPAWVIIAHGGEETA